MCPRLLKFGKCEREYCLFAHKQQELRPKPSFAKTKMCKYAMCSELCPNELCTFAHSEDELQPQVVKAGKKLKAPPTWPFQSPTRFSPSPAGTLYMTLEGGAGKFSFDTAEVARFLRGFGKVLHIDLTCDRAGAFVTFESGVDAAYAMVATNGLPMTSAGAGCLKVSFAVRTN
jgi:hypothetical protein